jgi:hypothetical protein
MTSAPVLLSLAAVAFLALPEMRGRLALAACALTLAVYAFCSALGIVRGLVVALVLAMGEASALVLLAGARRHWIRPVAVSSLVLGALSLLVHLT